MLSFLLLTLTSVICFAQQTNDKIDYLAFNFSHSLRIPNHIVSVEIIKRQMEVMVQVKSTPMNDDKGWKSTIVDTSFTIDKTKFIELANKVVGFNKIDLTKAMAGGLDGTECTIEFGTFGSTVAYKFWSPDYDTNKRDLSDFLSLCKTLIETGGFEPKEIL
jgi:hypothetical protein